MMTAYVTQSIPVNEQYLDLARCANDSDTVDHGKRLQDGIGLLIPSSLIIRVDTLITPKSQEKERVHRFDSNRSSAVRFYQLWNFLWLEGEVTPSWVQWKALHFK